MLFIMNPIAYYRNKENLSFDDILKDCINSQNFDPIYRHLLIKKETTIRWLSVIDNCPNDQLAKMVNMIEPVPSLIKACIKKNDHFIAKTILSKANSTYRNICKYENSYAVYILIMMKRKQLTASMINKAVKIPLIFDLLKLRFDTLRVDDRKYIASNKSMNDEKLHKEHLIRLKNKDYHVDLLIRFMEEFITLSKFTSSVLFFTDRNDSYPIHAQSSFLPKLIKYGSYHISLYDEAKLYPHVNNYTINDNFPIQFWFELAVIRNDYVLYKDLLENYRPENMGSIIDINEFWIFVDTKFSLDNNSNSYINREDVVSVLSSYGVDYYDMLEKEFNFMNLFFIMVEKDNFPKELFDLVNINVDNMYDKLSQLSSRYKFNIDRVMEKI